LVIISSDHATRRINDLTLKLNDYGAVEVGIAARTYPAPRS